MCSGLEKKTRQSVNHFLAVLRRDWRASRDCVLVAGTRTKPTVLHVAFKKKYVLRAFSFFDVYLTARNILTRMFLVSDETRRYNNDLPSRPVRQTPNNSLKSNTVWIPN